MKPETKLLRRIGAIPADERLPISRFARELNCSASVVIAMLEGLVGRGHLDPKTLRPGLVPASPSQPTEARAPCESPGSALRGRASMLAAPLVADIDAFLARKTMKPSRFTADCMRSPTALPRLRKPDATVKPETAARIRAFIDQHSAAQTSRAADRERDERQAKAPSPSPAEGGPDGGIAPTSGSPTGVDLADELAREAAARGITLIAFARGLWPNNTQTALMQLRQARRPKAYTIARVRALIANEPLPAVPAKPEGVVTCTRAAREERGLAPSGRMIREEKSLELRSRERAKIEAQRDICETRHDRREASAREIAAREAEARTARHAQAYRLTTRHPLDLADEADDEDAGALSADRRAREVEDLDSPSAVLRRAQRDWPDQCDKVKALAVELGVTLGEAWRRVIGAGVDCLTDPEAA